MKTFFDSPFRFFIFLSACGVECFIAPGKGCGISKPLRRIKGTDIPAVISNPEDFECLIEDDKEVFDVVLRKIQIAKCKQEIGTCQHVKGFHFVGRSSDCGQSVEIEPLDEAPTSWEGTDCKLVPKDIYEREEDNIKIQWCKDTEAACHDLPSGYYYQSGTDCGSPTNLIKLLEASDTSVECKIIPFSERLTDKSQWIPFGSSNYFSNSALSDPSFAIDNVLSLNNTQMFISAISSFQWLQVDLRQVHFVTRIMVELRRDCCAIRNSFFEARVGMEDTSSLPAGVQLAVNEVCDPGDTGNHVTKDYTCPSPLRGQFVTVQRTANDGWDTTINELEVYAVKFD